MTSRGAYVALLRGINVGGRNLLPMKDLNALFVAAGCDDVATYIQSGNVIFRADPALAARLPDAVEKSVLDRFGFRVPVVIRTGADLERVARSNPFLVAEAGDARDGGGEVDLARIHVAFLADAPDAARVAALDPDRSPGDAFAVRGREIYVRFGAGAAKTKLTNAYFDAKLATTSTLRNWRTVLALRDLSRRS